MKQNQIFEEVNKSISELLQNPLNFENSWISIKNGLPKNIYNHRQYKGVNIYLLSLCTFNKGFAKPGFLTFKQIKALGGSIKKGERANPIYFFDFFFKDRSNTRYDKTQVQTMSQKVQDALEIEKITFLKRFLVFNVMQTEGLPGEMYLIPELQNVSPVELNHRAEEILAASGANITVSPSNAAFYNPATDSIQLPDLRQFRETEQFYNVVFHELAHWTGHPSRLNRSEKYTSYKEKGYAFEELVAELTAAYLCATIGFQKTITNNAAYIQSWLEALQNESRFFVAAAKRAEEAAAYILKKLADSDNYPPVAA